MQITLYISITLSVILGSCSPEAEDLWYTTDYRFFYLDRGSDQSQYLDYTSLKPESIIWEDQDHFYIISARIAACRQKPNIDSILFKIERKGERLIITSSDPCADIYLGDDDEIVLSPYHHAQKEDLQLDSIKVVTIGQNIDKQCTIPQEVLLDHTTLTQETSTGPAFSVADEVRWLLDTDFTLYNGYTSSLTRRTYIIYQQGDSVSRSTTMYLHHMRHIHELAIELCKSNE